MLKSKSTMQYWHSFQCFQTFDSKESLMNAVKEVSRSYELSPTCEAVLNTLKLHSQQFFGVCWLKVGEIAKNAGVSARSVHRVLKDLSETGIITVHNWMHTTRGGKAHNVYVINPIDASSDTSDGGSDGRSQEDAHPLEPQGLEPDFSAHRNLDRDSDTNSDKNSKDSNNRTAIPNFNESVDKILAKEDLESIPSEFVDIFSPFYGNEPQTILARWKSACLAAKKEGISLAEAGWETVRQSWLNTIRQYKAKRLRRTDSDGLGAYFYKVLSDNLSAEYFERLREHLAYVQQGAVSPYKALFGDQVQSDPDDFLLAPDAY